MSEDTLTSDDYKNVIRVLAPRILRFVETVRTECELHITGADDDDMVHASVDSDGTLHDLMSFNRLLTARFPVTATMASPNGDQIEWTISRDELKQ